MKTAFPQTQTVQRAGNDGRDRANPESSLADDAVSTRPHRQFGTRTAVTMDLFAGRALLRTARVTNPSRLPCGSEIAFAMTLRQPFTAPDMNPRT